MGGDNELLIRAAIADELSAPLQAIRAELNEVTAAVGRLDAAGRVGAGRGLTSMRGAVGELGKLAKSTHGSLMEMSRGLGDAVVTNAKRALEGVTALAAGLTYLGVKATSNIESARLGIQTFVGDATKGNALFGQLRGLTGPFNLADVTASAQSLLTATDGADKLIPRMKALADIAATQADPKAALSTLAESLNKIQESGVIDARVLRPLMGAGVPVYELLSSELGVPVEQVKKTLASGAPLDLPVRFLTDIETEAGPLARFQGALDKQRSTLTGQFQGISLAFRGALGDVFAPLGDSLKSVTPLLRTGLVDLVRQIGPTLVGFLTSVVRLAGALLPILTPIATSLLGAIAQVVAALVPALNALAPQVPALATAFANLVIALIPLIPPLTDLLVALTPVMVLGLERLTTVITDLVRVVTPIIDRFAEWLDHSSALRSVLADLLIGILAYRAIATVVTTVLGLAKAIIAVKDAVIALKAAQGAGGMLRVLTGTATDTAAAGTAGEVSALASSATGLSAALGVLAPILGAVAAGALTAKLQSDRANQVGQFGDYATANRVDPTGKLRASAAAGDTADANYWMRTGASPASRYLDPYTDPNYVDPKTGKPADSGYISQDPRGYASAEADLARQGWRQDPKTGALVPTGGGAGAGAGTPQLHVTVNGDVVGETSGIFGRMRVLAGEVLAEHNRNTVERK